MEIQEDGGFITKVREISFRVDEASLSKILQVKKAGIKSIVDISPSKSFSEKGGNLKKLNPSVISKKLIKGQYQLYVEFVNKILLPRTEKRTIATIADLYLIEKLSTLVLINLPALMMEHMIKVFKMAERKHGLAYGFFTKLGV